MFWQEEQCLVPPGRLGGGQGAGKDSVGQGVAGSDTDRGLGAVEYKKCRLPRRMEKQILLGGDKTQVNSCLNDNDTAQNRHTSS
ncbi:hypothetical protein E2C01_060869 [Portunus trituberculatus]|uniref:Uncharacterized protein n=1 Tax=Portunus trituberculatus TaxID=210409 RepID=A0A5B7HBQ5_PORTR|nr:hypothetical protein [Portunus trituberculatus]